MAALPGVDLGTQQLHASLDVERRSDPGERQAELDERDRHGRPHADDDGFRVAGIGSRTTPNPLGDTRFIGNFYEVTLGLNWKPTDNFCVRPEARYDWFSGRTTNANVGPFDDGTSTDQFLFAIDAYLTY